MSRIDTRTSKRLMDTYSVTMADEVAESQRDEISRAVLSATMSELTPTTPKRSRLRVRVPALVAAVLLLLPVSAAFAAQDALPGDLLYPLKLVVEPIVGVFDRDFAATNRVDELERIINTPRSDTQITDAVHSARDAVSDLPVDHRLWDDLDALDDQIRPRPSDQRTTVGGDTPPDITTDTRSGSDTVPTDPAEDAPVGDSTQQRDDAEPPPDTPREPSPPEPPEDRDRTSDSDGSRRDG